MLLLFGGQYYMWDAGMLYDYKDTVAFHNMASIRIVNECLADSSSRTSNICTRLMMTLCLTEVMASREVVRLCAEADDNPVLERNWQYPGSASTHERHFSPLRHA
jgi:hypothetical protein